MFRFSNFSIRLGYEAEEGKYRLALIFQKMRYHNKYIVVLGEAVAVCLLMKYVKCKISPTQWSWAISSNHPVSHKSDYVIGATGCLFG